MADVDNIFDCNPTRTQVNNMMIKCTISFLFQVNLCRLDTLDTHTRHTHTRHTHTHSCARVSRLFSYTRVFDFFSQDYVKELHAYTRTQAIYTYTGRLLYCIKCDPQWVPSISLTLTKHLVYFEA